MLAVCALPLPSFATTLYLWEGDCTRRYWGNGVDPTRTFEVACPDKFRAYILMPDAYEPGASFHYGGGGDAAGFAVRWWDGDVLGTDPAPPTVLNSDHSIFGQLPEEEGHGEFRWECGGGCGRFVVNDPLFFATSPAWRVAFEMTLERPERAYVGYFLEGTTSEFRRIPEPAMLVLLCLSLIAFVALRPRVLTTK
jgi:hypothetical protein